VLVQPDAGTLGLALDLHRRSSETARVAGLSQREVGVGVPKDLQAPD